MDPRQRALLNTIRYAEGTWLGGSQDGYRVMFGGGKADPAKYGGRHPDTVIHGGRVSSAAAGAYQFMPDTWAEASRAVGAKPNQFFDPAVQDKAALLLAQRRLGKTQLGDSLTPDVMAKLAPEWASFPTLSGGSAYANQSVKKGADLNRFYQQQLAQLQGGGGAPAASGSTAAAPASPQNGGPPTAPPGQARPPAAAAAGGLGGLAGLQAAFGQQLRSMEDGTARIDAETQAMRKRRMAGSPGFRDLVLQLARPVFGNLGL